MFNLLGKMGIITSVKYRKGTISRDIIDIKKRLEKASEMIITNGGHFTETTRTEYEQSQSDLEYIIELLEERGILEIKKDKKSKNLFELAEKIKNQDQKATEKDIEFLNEKLQYVKRRLKG